MSAAGSRIAVVARQTGLSVDTIRAWERRYAVVAPRRDDRGARLYDAGDIARLRLMREVTRLGHAIGEVAQRSDAQLRRIVQVADGAAAESPSAAIVKTALDALARYDVAAAEAALTRAAFVLDPEELAVDVFSPLMREIGERWSLGTMNVAQEHVATQIVRGLANRFARLRPTRGADSLLFATPAGELHDVGISLAALIAASRGVGVCYIGPDIPLDDLMESVQRVRPAAVVLGLSVTPVPEMRRRYVSALEKRLPHGVNLLLGGRGGSECLRKPSRATALTTLEEFAQCLASYASSA
jgi:MerR family transcriptional regulator, light-induced transcriptional regulator